MGPTRISNLKNFVIGENEFDATFPHLENKLMKSLWLSGKADSNIQVNVHAHVNAHKCIVLMQIQNRKHKEYFTVREN